MSSATRSHLAVITALFALIHGALLIHGFSRPEAFMAGDRADARLEKINVVFFAAAPQSDSTLATEFDGQGESSPSAGNRPNLTTRLIAAGTPGDYAVHGMLHRLGGKTMVIAVQLLLAYVALICTYKLALLLGCSPPWALVSVLIYMVLPGSLILPHQLASESLYNPLVIMAFYLVCSHLERSSRMSILWAGLILLALAIGIRLPLLLYPFLLAPIVALIGDQNRLFRAASVLAISFLVPISWALFIQTQTGQMRVKSHDNNPALEFFKTAKKMSVVGDFEFDESAYPTGTMPMGEFVGFISEHPSAYARLKAMHVANLVLNPGIYSLAGHHLGLLEGAGDTNYWKGVRNREGYSGLLREIVRRGPLLAITIAMSLVLWGLLLLGATYGLIVFLRNEQPARVTKAVLVSFALYSCLIVQVSTDVRWGHRTPIEFFMAILCAIGIQRLWARRQRVAKSGDKLSRESRLSSL